MTTKKRVQKLRDQLFLDKNEIAEVEGCSIDGACKIMTNMRRWKYASENKKYPRARVLSEDFFNHFWLKADNKAINKNISKEGGYQ